MEFSFKRVEESWLSERTIERRNHHVCTCFAMMHACLAMMSFVFAPAVICEGCNLEYHDRCAGCPEKSQFSLH